MVQQNLATAAEEEICWQVLPNLSREALLCKRPDCLDDPAAWFASETHPTLTATAYNCIVVVIQVAHNLQAEHLWPLTSKCLDFRPDPLVLLLHLGRAHWYMGTMDMASSLRLPACSLYQQEAERIAQHTSMPCVHARTAYELLQQAQECAL